MTPQQKKFILRFMRLTLWNMHPNFNEYPIHKMSQVVNEGNAVDGTGFEDTEYQNCDDLIEAYWLNDAIEKLEKA